MTDIHIVQDEKPAEEERFPIIVAEQVKLNMIMHPNGTDRLLVVGPLLIGLPVGDAASRWLIDNLNAAASGLIIATAGP